MFRRKKAPRSTGARLNSYSYYKSSTKTTPAVGKRKGFLKKLRLSISISRLAVIALGLVVVGYLLSVDTSPIIRFSSTGVTARDTDLYRSESKKVIETSIFNRTKLTFDYRGVEQDLMKEFPEIEAIRISFDLVGRKPVVQLFMHDPTYLFRTGGTAWAIDDRGIAIGRQQDLKESFTQPLKLITDEVGADAEVGDTLMSPSQIEYLTSVIKLLEKQLIIVESIYIPSQPRQIDIIIRGESWRYKLNSDSDPSQQAGTILAAQSTLRANGNTPTEYVDVRVPEKVYWK